MRQKMSDPEDDREILDEIKALEDVLAKDEWSKASNDYKDVSICNLPSRRTNVPSRGFGEVTPQREAEIIVPDIVPPSTAYETNKKLIQLLQESKRELLAILEKCIENKSIIEEKIRITANNTKNSKVYVGFAGMPYFKDAKHYPAPRNRDTMIKAQKNELQVVHLCDTCPWTAKDRNTLWRAIRQEASAAVLETEQQRNGQLLGASENDNFQESCKAELLNLPKNFNAMIGPLGAREFDWLKIAVTDFDNKHTPEECKVMWRVFLHPDINRYRWTKEEDSKIEKLSKQYKRQNWETVAKELETKRSGYQCFIRYNTNNRTMRSNDSLWSKKEDAKLQKCFNKFKIGHYIPWGTVARYMDGRNKGQVYFRWMFNVAPHLKKGRFTPKEDSKLIDAVAKYGMNFGTISENVMPNRTSAQLSNHYRTLVQREHGVCNSWNVSDDAKLLKLYPIYGADWSSIAQALPGKTRTQVRHRHKSILRYWDKGISLYDIPRKCNKSEARTVGDIDVIDRLERERIEHSFSEMQQIDLELTKFFRFIPSPLKPGRKQKYYRDDELEKTTRNLYNLLETLNANLAIPDELDHRSLTEKDKQLLKSLKDHQQLQSEYAVSPTTVVECARMKVFRPKTVENDAERHFKPLCSGNCNQREKEKWYDSIDCQNMLDSDNCQIKLNMEFHTPTIVSTLLGEEKNDEFNKLMRIFQRREKELCQRNIVHKIYVLPPQECSTTLSRDSRSYESNRQVNNSTMNTKKERDIGRARSWDSSICKGIIHQQNPYNSCVEPNYYTLLGLQHIILKTTNPQFSESDLPTSEKGTRSLETLKKRLVQLFKYPIGLSHILRPKVYVRKSQSNTLSDNGTNLVKDTVDDFPNTSSSLTKRRRLTDERKKPTCPKNRRGRSRKV